jgi:hypothetical protein
MEDDSNYWERRRRREGLESEPGPPSQFKVSFGSIDLDNLVDSHEVHLEVAHSIHKADENLSTHRVVDALDVYTEVLEHESEGHPIALLNRSFCYLLLEHPSLAVVDACKLNHIPAMHHVALSAISSCHAFLHQKATQFVLIRDTDRAYIATTWTQDDPTGERIISQILSCIETYATPLKLKTTTKVLLRPLMVINFPTASYSVPLARCTTSKNLKKEIKKAKEWIYHVRAKALYRLCLALFKCGGGAIKSAHDMLSKGLEDEYFTEEDSDCLKDLGSEIFKEFERLYHEKDGDDRQVVDLALESRMTLIPREQYAWDKTWLGSPKTDSFGYWNEFQQQVQDKFPNTRVAFRSKERTSAKIILIATSDFTEGAVISSQSSSFFVTSENKIDSLKTHFCDTCAAQMVLEEPNGPEPSVEHGNDSVFITDSEMSSTDFLSSGTIDSTADTSAEQQSPLDLDTNMSSADHVIKKTLESPDKTPNLLRSNNNNDDSPFKLPRYPASSSPSIPPKDFIGKDKENIGLSPSNVETPTFWDLNLSRVDPYAEFDLPYPEDGKLYTILEDEREPEEEIATSASQKKHFEDTPKAPKAMLSKIKYGFDLDMEESSAYPGWPKSPPLAPLWIGAPPNSEEVDWPPSPPSLAMKCLELPPSQTDGAAEALDSLRSPPNDSPYAPSSVVVEYPELPRSPPNDMKDYINSSPSTCEIAVDNDARTTDTESTIPIDSPFKDYRYCWDCHRTFYCSYECTQLKNENGHRITCEVYDAVERGARRAIGCGWYPKMHNQEQYLLQSMMFVRLLSSTFALNNPLQARWIAWQLDGDFELPLDLMDDSENYDNFMYRPPPFHIFFPHLKDILNRPPTRKGKERTTEDTIMQDAPPSCKNPDAYHEENDEYGTCMPWSFLTHVLLPIQHLRAIGHLDLALDTKRCDGWMINILMSKIEKCMRVTKNPRQYKIYREALHDKGLVGDERSRRDERLQTNVWVRSLHPMESLLSGSPDAEENPEPNVTLVECGRTVYAVAGTNVELAKRTVLKIMSRSQQTAAEKASQASNGSVQDASSAPSVSGASSADSGRIAIPAGTILRAHPVVQYLPPPDVLEGETFLSSPASSSNADSSSPRMGTPDHGAPMLSESDSDDSDESDDWFDHD